MCAGMAGRPQRLPERSRLRRRLRPFWSPVTVARRLLPLRCRTQPRKLSVVVSGRSPSRTVRRVAARAELLHGGASLRTCCDRGHAAVGQGTPRRSVEFERPGGSVGLRTRQPLSSKTVWSRAGGVLLSKEREQHFQQRLAAGLATVAASRFDGRQRGRRRTFVDTFPAGNRPGAAQDRPLAWVGHVPHR